MFLSIPQQAEEDKKQQEMKAQQNPEVPANNNSHISNNTNNSNAKDIPTIVPQAKENEPAPTVPLQENKENNGINENKNKVTELNEVNENKNKVTELNEVNENKTKVTESKEASETSLTESLSVIVKDVSDTKDVSVCDNGNGIQTGDLLQLATSQVFLFIFLLAQDVFLLH